VLELERAVVVALEKVVGCVAGKVVDAGPVIFGTGLRHDVLRERSRTSLLIPFSSLAGRLLGRRLILRQQLQQLLPLRLVCCSGEEPQIVLELFSVDEPVHGRCTAYANARESFADYENVSLWLRETV
jgi:hypothetical protein